VQTGQTRGAIGTIAVVLPAYNEAGNITPLVTELWRVAAAAGLILDIVVVNDGSADETSHELSALQSDFPRLHVVTHPTNLGFSRALKSGIATVCRERFDAAVFMDCDLSHRPSDMPAMIEALSAGNDVALGSRFVPGGGMAGVPLWRVFISRAGNAFGRRVLGIPIRDLTTGYRAVRREVLEQVQPAEAGFLTQLETTVRTWAAGYRVVEVPIVLMTRRHGVSHMFYGVDLFVGYWRLLMKCRGWMREGEAMRAQGSGR
jgi:dolichol-phosphate mannosyltransferase